MDVNFKLRPWQVDAIGRLRQSNDNVMIQAATGAGKTMMICEYLRTTNRTALIIVHNLRLLYQWEESLKEFGVDYNLYHGDNLSVTGGKKVILSTFQTLGSRRHRLSGLILDDIIADESHKGCSDTYVDIYETVKARRIGITATPVHNNQELMRDTYGEIMVTSELGELFSSGVLVRPELISPSSYFNSVKGTLRSSDGDYTPDSMSKIATHKGQDAYGTVEAYKEYVQGDSNERTLVFATDVMHAKSIEASFLMDGILAEVIIAETHLSERDRIFKAFKLGTLRVIISVEVLSEGFDERLAKHAIIARPTRSLSKGLQIFGRVMRSDPAKTSCQIIDLAGTFLSIGLPTWNVDWVKVYNSDERSGHRLFDEMDEEALEFEATGDFIKMACKDEIDHGLYQAAIYIGPEGDARYSKCPKCAVEASQYKTSMVDVALEHVGKARILFKSLLLEADKVYEAAVCVPKCDFEAYVWRNKKYRGHASTINTISKTITGKYPYCKTLGAPNVRRAIDNKKVRALLSDISMFQELEKIVTIELRSFLKVYKVLVGKDHQQNIRVNSIIFKKSKDGYVTFEVRDEVKLAIKQVEDIQRTLKGSPMKQ